MKYYSFDDYWKNFGKFHNSIIKNDRKLEEDFYELAKSIWLEADGTKDDTYEMGHFDGYEACEIANNIKNDD